MPTKSLRKRILSDRTNEEDREYAVEDIIDYDPRSGDYLVKWENYEDPT